MSQWRYCGAAVTGFSHQLNNTPCQDAWQVATFDGGLVACVSDGAGSARHSQRGSQLLVDKVTQQLAQQPQLATQATVLDQLQQVISEVRAELMQEGDLNDYHATLCGVLTHQHGSLLFHLGDGVILGINPDDWQDVVCSEPENGEFAETTYFFTLENWQQHLRVFSVPKHYRLWFLCSDGAASFAVKQRPYAPDEGFLRPVHQYLCQHPEAAPVLAATLADERTATITSDDKTLLWLYRAST